MKCKYRNCEKEIEGRANKQYCTRNHKDMERTYRKREKKKCMATDDKSGIFLKEM